MAKQPISWHCLFDTIINFEMTPFFIISLDSLPIWHLDLNLDLCWWWCWMTLSLSLSLYIYIYIHLIICSSFIQIGKISSWYFFSFFRIEVGPLWTWTRYFDCEVNHTTHCFLRLYIWNFSGKWEVGLIFSDSFLGGFMHYDFFNPPIPYFTSIAGALRN